MTLAFATLNVKPAPAPEPKTPKGSKIPELTDDIREFGQLIADAEHGLIVEGVDAATVRTIKSVLRIHRETLFGTWTPKYRLINDKKDLRITLVAGAGNGQPDEAENVPAA